MKKNFLNLKRLGFVLLAAGTLTFLSCGEAAADDAAADHADATETVEATADDSHDADADAHDHDADAHDHSAEAADTSAAGGEMEEGGDADAEAKCEEGKCEEGKCSGGE